MFDLTGHVALVTGSNGGLGLAKAKGLLKAGAKLAIWGDVEALVCEVTDTSQAFQDAAKRRSAAGEVGRLEDMEGIAVDLASPESRFMTGHGLVLDGGQSIYPG